MKIYDATFSTDKPNGTKPGERPLPRGQGGSVGVTTLEGCEPVEWSGSAWGPAKTEKDYTPARIAAWRRRVQRKPGQLGIVDIEHIAQECPDEALKNIFIACAADGIRVGTFGGCWGTHRLQTRDGKNFNTLITEFISKKVEIDDAIMRRLDALAPVLEPLEYLTVEVQNDQPRYFQQYIEHHARWSDFYSVRFPEKKRLSWFCPAWTHHAVTGEGGYWPMNAAELTSWKDAFALAGNDCLIWGPWQATRGYFGK